MMRLCALGLLLVHGVLGCTMIDNNLAGRLRENQDASGEPLFVLEGNEVGVEIFASPGSEHQFSVHSRGRQGMRGVVVKAETRGPGCGMTTPTADDSEQIPNCPGGISSTGEPKRHFLFRLKAPQCGCVTIRVMVVGVDRHVYGEDKVVTDGHLTKTVCLKQNDKEISNEIPVVVGQIIPVLMPVNVPQSVADEIGTTDTDKGTTDTDKEANITDTDNVSESREEESKEVSSNRELVCRRFDRMHGGGHGAGRGGHHAGRSHGRGRGHHSGGGHSARGQHHAGRGRGKWHLGRRGGRRGHHGRRGGHRMFKRAIRGPRGRYHVVIEQEPEPQIQPEPLVHYNEETVEEERPFGNDWRFRRALARECCPLPEVEFDECYESMTAERHARLNGRYTTVNGHEKPVNDDPDYIPSSSEEQSAYTGSEEYEFGKIDSQELTDLINDDPDYVPTQVDKDLAYGGSEEYESAEIDSQELTDLINDDPDYVPTQVDIDLAYGGSEEYENEKIDSQELADLINDDPDYVPTQVDKDLAYGGSEEYESAEIDSQELTDLINDDPDYVPTQVDKDLAYGGSEEYESAEIDSQEVTDIINDDPDYVPTQAEEDAAFTGSEEEYNEDELIDEDEVTDLITDTVVEDDEENMSTYDDEEPTDDDNTECALEGRRGRKKCLMRECCVKGKAIGRAHRGVMWKKCIAGSRSIVFKRAVTRRQKHKCRIVFRHCCVAAGRKRNREESAVSEGDREEPNVDSENQQSSSVEEKHVTSQVDRQRVRQARLWNRCCAAGARVEGPRDLSKCRRESRNMATGLNVLLRQKCHQKFIRCCVIREVERK